MATSRTSWAGTGGATFNMNGDAETGELTDTVMTGGSNLRLFLSLAGCCYSELRF